MSNRKRLNLSISEQMYLDVEELAKYGGFGGSCAFVSTLVEAFIKYANTRRKQPKKPIPIEQEIREMFAALEDGEQAAKLLPSHWSNKTKGKKTQ